VAKIAFYLVMGGKPGKLTVKPVRDEKDEKRIK